MSTPPPVQPEKVTIDGKSITLRPCTRCTGTVMIAFMGNKEKDSAKSPIWDIRNKDGSVHEHNTKRQGGGWTPRPPTPKFVLRIKKTFGTAEIEMTADCTSLDELTTKFNDLAKDEALQENRKA